MYDTRFYTLTLLWARPLGTASITAHSFQLTDLDILATYDYRKKLHDDNGVDGGGDDDDDDGKRIEGLRKNGFHFNA